MPVRTTGEPVLVGCDFGSTTAKAVVLSPDRELLFSCYALSKGNPIEDAKDLLRQIANGGLRTHRRARAHRLRQGSAQGHPRRRRRRRRDGRACAARRCTTFPTPT